MAADDLHGGVGASPPEDSPKAPAPAPADPELDRVDGGKRRRPLVDAFRRVRDGSLKKGATEVLTGAFDERRTELEELAVTALRRALIEESARIEQLIERSVEVKRREVRLSLLVLVAASLLYAALAWISSALGGGAA